MPLLSSRPGADPNADAKRIARWERELREAVVYHRTLDVNDAALVGRLDARFRALIAEDAP